MPSPFLQCRAGGGLRERAETAASETGLELGTWLRTVVELACIAHEDVELVESRSQPGTFHQVRRTQGTCDCLGFENAGHCWHLEQPRPGQETGQLLDGSETYDSARLEAEAAEVREAGIPPTPRVEHPPTDIVVDPRTMDHESSNEEAKPEVEQLSQRDCPHLPGWRVGGRCRCGAKLGGGARMRR